MKPRKINPQNIRRLCWKRGLSVTEFAALIGRHRVTVHRAARHPRQFAETYRLMERALFPEPNAHNGQPN